MKKIFLAAIAIAVGGSIYSAQAEPNRPLSELICPIDYMADTTGDKVMGTEAAVGYLHLKLGVPDPTHVATTLVFTGQAEAFYDMRVLYKDDSDGAYRAIVLPGPDAKKARLQLYIGYAGDPKPTRALLEGSFDNGYAFAVAGNCHRSTSGGAAEQKRLADEWRHRMNAAMDAAMPGWRQINTDPKFIAWAKAPSATAGKTRQQLMQELWLAGDAGRLAAMFKAYLKTK